MATRTDRFLSAAVRAARRAKQWALAAARGADRLLEEAQKQAESEDRRRRLKRTLTPTRGASATARPKAGSPTSTEPSAWTRFWCGTGKSSIASGARNMRSRG
jgi:hypothetical protein